jgi:hypothetical protein
VVEGEQIIFQYLQPRMDALDDRAALCLASLVRMAYRPLAAQHIQCHHIDYELNGAESRVETVDRVDLDGGGVQKVVSFDP